MIRHPRRAVNCPWSTARGQLPYIADDDHIVGDSDTIIAYLTEKYQLTLDSHPTASRRTLDRLIRRTLDRLYWVMSYSRWHDPQYWPLFRGEMPDTHSVLRNSGLGVARKYNCQRYYYQGIGRYAPGEVHARGVADLRALASLMPADGFPFGAEPSGIDAGIDGFIANIVFFVSKRR